MGRWAKQMWRGPRVEVQKEKEWGEQRPLPGERLDSTKIRDWRSRGREVTAAEAGKPWQPVIIRSPGCTKYFYGKDYGDMRYVQVRVGVPVGNNDLEGEFVRVIGKMAEECIRLMDAIEVRRQLDVDTRILEKKMRGGQA